MNVEVWLLGLARGCFQKGQSRSSVVRCATSARAEVGGSAVRGDGRGVEKMEWASSNTGGGDNLKSRRVAGGLLSIDGLDVSGRGDGLRCFADGPASA